VVYLVGRVGRDYRPLPNRFCLAYRSLWPSERDVLPSVMPFYLLFSRLQRRQMLLQPVIAGKTRVSLSKIRSVGVLERWREHKYKRLLHKFDGFGSLLRSVVVLFLKGDDFFHNHEFFRGASLPFILWRSSSFRKSVRVSFIFFGSNP
jgi:hypothetical protein